MIDPQGNDNSDGATGMVALFCFSQDGKDIQVEYYPPVQKRYLRADNQFTMQVETVESSAPAAAADAPVSESGSVLVPVLAVLAAAAVIAGVVVCRRKKAD